MQQVNRYIDAAKETFNGTSELIRISRSRPWYDRPNKRFGGVGYMPVKRVMDVVLCIFLLIPVLGVIALCAILIKLDSSGPIFFVQERTGRGGKKFKMFKLRSMVKGADLVKAQLNGMNRLNYPDFKIPGDPRITGLGRFLRKTSLDELPQLFNVLGGEMSLVGPRPTSFSSSTYDLWQTVRLEVRPGITGLWQVSGRSEIDFDSRSRLDAAYIRNVSLLLDIKIMLRTFAAIINRHGAE